MTATKRQWCPEDVLDWDHQRAVAPDGTVLTPDRYALEAMHGPKHEWRARQAAHAYADELEKLGVTTPGVQRAQPPPAIDVDKLPALVGKKEAAAVLRCSERSIDRLIAEGTLRASRRSLRGSSRVLIERASLLAHLDSIRA